MNKVEPIYNDNHGYAINRAKEVDRLRSAKSEKAQHD